VKPTNKSREKYTKTDADFDELLTVFELVFDFNEKMIYYICKVVKQLFNHTTRYGKYNQEEIK